MQTHPKRDTHVQLRTHTCTIHNATGTCPLHRHTPNPAFSVTRQSWDTAVWEQKREGVEKRQEGEGGDMRKEQTEKIKEGKRENWGEEKRENILRRIEPNNQQEVCGITKCIRAMKTEWMVEIAYWLSDTDPNNESKRDSRGWQTEREGEWMGRVALVDKEADLASHLNSCCSLPNIAPQLQIPQAARQWGAGAWVSAFSTHSWALCSKQPGDALTTAHAKGHKVVAIRGLELFLAFSDFCT